MSATNGVHPKHKPRDPRHNRRKSKRYTPAEKIAAVNAVAANGGNVMKTARELCIPEPTLRNWVMGERCDYIALFADRFRGDMKSAFERAAWQALALADKTAKDAPYQHLIKGAAVALEKYRLLDGLPGSLDAVQQAAVTIDVTRLSRDEQDRLAELLEKAGYGNDDTGRASGDVDELGPRQLPPVPETELRDSGGDGSQGV